jgi:hypothetical protein
MQESSPAPNLNLILRFFLTALSGYRPVIGHRRDALKAARDARVAAERADQVTRERES